MAMPSRRRHGRRSRRRRRSFRELGARLSAARAAIVWYRLWEYTPWIPCESAVRAATGVLTLLSNSIRRSYPGGAAPRRSVARLLDALPTSIPCATRGLSGCGVVSRSTEAPRRTRPEAPRAGAARGSHRARRRARRPGARPPRRCLTGRGRLHRPRRGRRRIGWRSGRPGASVAAHGAQRTHGGSGLADGSLHEEMGRLLGSRRRPGMAAARSSSHATRPHQTTVARSTIRRACMKGRS